MRARLEHALARLRWQLVGRPGRFGGGTCMVCSRPGLTRREGRLCDRCDAVMWRKT